MKSSTLTRLFSTAAVLGALAAPAAADDHEGISLPGASAEVTVDYVTNYFFRGYEQLESDSGVVIQPGASFTIPVVDGVTATVGTWGSIHTGLDGAAPGTTDGSWYEQDIYASIDATFGDFTASIGYTLYTYPTLPVNGVHEIGLGLSFDDSEYLGDFAFSPYVFVGIEVNNTNALNGTGDEAVYLEIGGAFSLDSLTEGTFAEVWSWEVPVVFGLSLDDYYVSEASGSEEFLGYISVGLVGSVPLSEYIGTDEYVGAWDLTLGVTALFLNNEITGGPATGGIQATDSLNGTNVQFIGTIGIAREW